MAEDRWTSVAKMTRREWIASAAAGIALLSAKGASLYAEETKQAVVESFGTRMQDFDDDWLFARGDFAGAEQIAWRDEAWRSVRLPHDWSIEGEIDQRAASSGQGGYMPTGIGWYRKHFEAAESDRERILTIFFDGIYENSTVWINGHKLGDRPYGFVPFWYELTPYLKFRAENVIAVRVDNSQQPNCRWYSGSGIYRHTHLCRTADLHFAPWGIFAWTRSISGQEATVLVRGKVRNAGNKSRGCTVRAMLTDREGETIATKELPVNVTAGSELTVELALVVAGAKLWSPEDPHLYRLQCEINDEGTATDATTISFGIREARFDADHGFLLNGQRVKLKGVCVHPEGGCVGAAVPVRVWERRLELLKAMGCNAIRTSHNPFAAEFLDLCDQMGFLVMAEAFDEWRVPKDQVKFGYSRYFDAWHERDLRDFLRRDCNHPSIVIWSAGNEIGDQAAPNGTQTLLELKRIIHEEDPTRPVTAACDRIASEPLSNRVKPEFLEALDVVGYNYVDRWRERAQLYYSIDRAAHPKRRFVGTESIGIGGIRGDYQYLMEPSQPAVGMHFLPQQNLIVDTESLWKFVREYDYVAGDFMWTGIDYLGEAVWPMRGSTFGALDTCGFQKDAYYFYQSQWTEAPMVHLSPHWSWHGQEGAVIPIACFTNCETVELFLNGRSMGVKGYEFPRIGMQGVYGNYPARAKSLRTTSDLHLSWDVPYEPGEIKAVGMNGGRVVATQEVMTVGASARIHLTSDRLHLQADGRDVAHITVMITDDAGRQIPSASDMVSFTVEGAGRLIGVDNGNPFSHQRYQGNVQTAFHGLCLAIVQSTQQAGQFHFRASASGLSSAEITVSTG